MSKKKKSKKPYTNYTPAIIALSAGLLVFLLALILGNGGASPHNRFDTDTAVSNTTTFPPISLPVIVESAPSPSDESDVLTPYESDILTDPPIASYTTGESAPPETVAQTTAPVERPAISYDDSQTVSDSYSYDGETLYFKTVTYPIVIGGFPTS